MPQNERLRVWKGELKKTSGGLTKGDLIKNKRGKVVSKKKSEAAKKNSENNLGSWLRSKGDQFLSKGLVQEGKKIKMVGKKKVVAKPRVVAPKVVAEKKVGIKIPKKIPKKKKQLPFHLRAAAAALREVPVKPGAKHHKKMIPKSKISVGNIKIGKRIPKKRVLHNVS